MNELLQNIDKVHTTPMGVERIKRNLNISGDVVLWCRAAIESADNITRQGKNWYAYKNDVIITVNSFSFTIITSHRLKVNIN